MDFLFDPAIWAGLLTLIVLEIVLGIDNLVFVAILAKKLPADQQNRAVYTGLSMALLMRIGLLSIMSWLVTLTTPLFSLFEHPFSARDLILIAGGAFLLFKATLELHERLEAHPHKDDGSHGRSTFWLVIAQILLLDAVFSLDSIITAVGMVDKLGVMITAVIIAMIVMIVASRPLTQFVNRHPTVVVLCLSFLLMIGFSLVAEGLGFHIPKGYLYAAISFSIMIEAFNQLARRNSANHLARLPFRERTTRAIVRLMSPSKDSENTTMAEQMAPSAPSFGEDERHMVEGVLTLAERSIKSIMTPRSDIVWLNLRRPMDELMQQVRSCPTGPSPSATGRLTTSWAASRPSTWCARSLRSRSFAAWRRRATSSPCPRRSTSCASCTKSSAPAARSCLWPTSSASSRALRPRTTSLKRLQATSPTKAIAMP